MIERFFLIVIITSMVVVVVSLIMLIREKIIIGTLPIHKLKIPVRLYALLVLEWCNNNIMTNPIKIPELVISNRHTKKMYGVFCPKSNEITVYLKKHQTILELTNTIIHEFVHATQKGKGFEKNYDALSKSLGYWNNPYEIESRNIANSRDSDCLSFLYRQYKIV
jgi:hypothetical protein